MKTLTEILAKIEDGVLDIYDWVYQMQHSRRYRANPEKLEADCKNKIFAIFADGDSASLWEDTAYLDENTPIYKKPLSYICVELEGATKEEADKIAADNARHIMSVITRKLAK